LLGFSNLFLAIVVVFPSVVVVALLPAAVAAIPVRCSLARPSSRQSSPPSTRPLRLSASSSRSPPRLPLQEDPCPSSLLASNRPLHQTRLPARASSPRPIVPQSEPLVTSPARALSSAKAIFHLVARDRFNLPPRTSVCPVAIV
jgi:hypothetical protein